MNSKWVIQKSDLISNIFIFLMCIPPSFAERMGMLSSVYKYAKWGALLYAILILIQKHGTIEKIDIATYVWFVWTAISVAVNGTGLYGWFSKYYPYFTIYVLSRDRLEKNAKNYIEFLAWIFMFLLLGNHISWMMPGTKVMDELGEPLYLIGIRTRISDVLFIAIAIASIAVILNRSKMKWKVLLAIILVTGISFSIGE